MAKWLSYRWRAALCWGSLALNVVLIGLIVFHPRPPHPPPPPSPERVTEHMADALSEADRRLLESAFAARKAEIDAHFATIDARFDAFQKALAHEPFDADAARTAKRELDAARTSFEQAYMDMLIGALEKMSPEGRARLSRFPGPPPPP